MLLDRINVFCSLELEQTLSTNAALAAAAAVARTAVEPAKLPIDP